MIILDFETRSRVDLKTSGVSKYLACPDFGVLVVAVKFDEQPAVALYRGNPDNWGINQELIRRIMAMETIVAHNSGFDYRVYRRWAGQMGWPDTPITQWVCTQTAAYAAGFPGRLGEVGVVLKLGTKLVSGTRLINLLCKPGADGQFRNDWKKLKPMVDYALRDVELTSQMVPRLWQVLKSLRTPTELELQTIDFEMNETGLLTDAIAVDAALAINAQMCQTLNTKMVEVTGSLVGSTTQLPALVRFARRWYPQTASVDKDSIESFLSQRDLPPELRKALKIRQAACNTSVAKFKAIQNMAMADGRVRNTLRYYGAFTGRWAGRGVQTQNLPSGDIAGHDNATLAESLHNHGKLPAGVPWGKGLSAAIRGCIIAPAGDCLVASDYNAIECRVLAWLADEKSLLRLFAQGEDPYIPMAAAILKKHPEDVTKAERKKWGKATVLGCGYGMGAAKFAVFNGVTETDAALAVTTYRSKHPAIKGLWRLLEKAALHAVLNPNTWTCVNGKVYFRVEGEFLECLLPSGRKLFYLQPDASQEDRFNSGELSYRLSYLSRFNSTVVKTHTHGGVLTENICQAIARDIIANGLIEAGKKGLRLILQVHDEVVCEVPVGDVENQVKVLEACLLAKAPWMEGLPLGVESWHGKRYKK